MPRTPDWKPDAATLRWCFLRADEARIKKFVRKDVLDRTKGLSTDSDEYWTTVSEVVIESVLYDLVELAKQEGTVFDDE